MKPDTCILCKEAKGDCILSSYACKRSRKTRIVLVCRSCNTSRHKAWRDRNPGRMYEIVRKSTLKHWDRTLARQRLNYHVAHGDVKKPTSCACGSTERIEGHHEDYSKPLEVTWMCRRCHNVADRLRRKAELSTQKACSDS